VDILSKIQTLVVSYFDPADMKAVHDTLYGIRLTARSCGQGKDPEVRVLCHHEANDLVISIIASSTMRFV